MIKDQEMYDQDKIWGIRGLLKLERLEMICDMRKLKNDKAKLRLVIKSFKNDQIYYPNNIDTFSNFKSDFCNMHWTLIINASPHKLYYEAFKLAYVADSQVDIKKREILLAKFLYPNMSIKDFTNKVDVLDHPVDLDSIIVKFVCLATDAQKANKPAHTAAVSESPKVNKPLTICKGKHEQVNSACLTNEQNFPFDVLNYFRSFVVYIETKKTDIFYERNIASKSAKQKCKVEQNDHPENLNSFASFTASFYDKSWSVIKNTAGIRVMYFEQLKTNYLAELKVDSQNRQFFLFKHLYPDMSLEELKYSVDRLIIRLPCDIAAAMKRAVYKTKPVQLNVLLPQCTCPLIQLVPLENARRQRQGKNRGCEYTSIVHVKLSKPLDASALAECERDQLFLVEFESQRMAEIFRPLRPVLMSSIRSLYQSKLSVSFLITFEVFEYSTRADDVKKMMMVAYANFKSPKFLINLEDFDCISSYKAQFLSTHLALINAYDFDLPQDLLDSFKEKYLAESQLDIGSRKHLLLHHPHLNLKKMVDKIKKNEMYVEYVEASFRRAVNKIKLL